MKAMVGIGVAGLLATAVVGCSSYRVVQKTPDSGVLALQGDRNAAHEKAEQYMASQCPGGYDIVEEGEAVVGSTTQQQTSGGKTFFGAPALNTTSNSHDTTEWRVKYKCKGAASGGESAPTEKASPPSGGGSPQQSSEIREIIIRI